MSAILIQGNTRVPHLVFAVSRRTRLPSVVTRLATSGALWSHSAFYDVERGVMNEALLFKGMVQTPVHEWVQRYPSREFFAVPVPDPAAGIAWRRSILGQGYDYLGALGVPWRGDWQAEGRWYCSEADTVTCLHAGRQLFVDHDGVVKSRGVCPHDFWRVGRALGLSPSPSFLPSLT
jgi:hypothetical protein